MTRTKDSYVKHLFKHPKTARLLKPKTCIHCNSKFKSELSHDDHVVRKHPDFIKSVTRKLYTCTKCPYQTIIKSNFEKHVSVHSKDANDFTKCVHCDTMFTDKVSLDDHLAKNHPNFFTPIARKVYACTICVYKTDQKSVLDRHMSTHPGTVSGSQRISCVHCDATFKFKISLDDHVVRKHPKFIKSVTRKLHECSKCSYKTTIKSNLSKHVTIHPVAASSHKCKYSRCNEVFRSKKALEEHVKEHFETASTKRISKCVHCNATFKSKKSLDVHVLKKHGNYKTSTKNKLGKHMLVHPESSSSYEPSTCTHCNVVFKSKKALDDHVVREHPNFIKSVDRKIYRCTDCIYKTVFKYKFERHMSAHPEAGSS
nr:unnamed protein product [Callosobruchus analis]